MRRRNRIRRCMAALLSAGMVLGAGAAGPLPAMAQARVAAVPSNVTVTKSGVVYSDTKKPVVLTAASAVTAAAPAAGMGETCTCGPDMTVLDVDDLYYGRYAVDPLIIAQAGVRFHNVKLGDPRQIVEKKLGNAFTKSPSSNAAGNVEIYYDTVDNGRSLWVQYDAQGTVQFLIYQRVAG